MPTCASRRFNRSLPKQISTAAPRRRAGQSRLNLSGGADQDRCARHPDERSAPSVACSAGRAVSSAASAPRVASSRKLLLRRGSACAALNAAASQRRVGIEALSKDFHFARATSAMCSAPRRTSWRLRRRCARRPPNLRQRLAGGPRRSVSGGKPPWSPHRRPRAAAKRTLLAGRSLELLPFRPDRRHLGTLQAAVPLHALHRWPIAAWRC